MTFEDWLRAMNEAGTTQLKLHVGYVPHIKPLDAAAVPEELRLVWSFQQDRAVMHYPTENQPKESSS